MKCYSHPTEPAIGTLNGIPLCAQCHVDAAAAGVEIENAQATKVLKAWTEKQRPRRTGGDGE